MTFATVSASTTASACHSLAMAASSCSWVAEPSATLIENSAAAFALWPTKPSVPSNIEMPSNAFAQAQRWSRNGACTAIENRPDTSATPSDGTSR